MAQTYNDPVMLDSTGQDIVDKLDSIASLMGDGVIDDTSTTATDKTWSASKLNSDKSSLQSNVIANTKLIKDTVGWSGKNLFDYGSFKGTTTENAGITFAIDNEGKVKCTGTATASPTSVQVNYTLPAGNYILNGCPANGSDSSYRLDIPSLSKNDYGNGVEFILDAETQIAVRIRFANGYVCPSGGIEFKPMIRPADILDDTYEPYFGSTAFPRSEQAVLGAKNLLENKAITQTVNGITLTVNEDKSFTVNGTESSGNNADFDINSTLYLEEGTKLILSAEGIGNNDSTRLFLYYVADYTKLNVYVSANYDAGIITIPLSGIYRVYFRVLGSKTVTNMTIKPMLRLASDTDDTYAPYAMTNKELMEKAFIDRGALTSSNNLDSVTDEGLYHISSSPTNAPESVSWCSMLVVKGNATDIRQIIIKGGDTPCIYVRSYGGGTPHWYSWFKFTGTVVS